MSSSWYSSMMTQSSFWSSKIMRFIILILFCHFSSSNLLTSSISSGLMIDRKLFKQSPPEQLVAVDHLHVLLAARICGLSGRNEEVELLRASAQIVAFPFGHRAQTVVAFD
mmetsp:Transcript_28685/g.32782  ORF Transcript_28685/g.32782 Transcript_28685/m.32782 type:complete len:111 (+) Transcript_28685:52-384(+)